MTVWLVSYLAARTPLSGWSRCLAVWLSGCLAVWMSGCLAVWLSGCLPAQMAAWLSGSPALQLSGRLLPTSGLTGPCRTMKREADILRRPIGRRGATSRRMTNPPDAQIDATSKIPRRAACQALSFSDQNHSTAAWRPAGDLAKMIADLYFSVRKRGAVIFASLDVEIKSPLTQEIQCRINRRQLVRDARPRASESRRRSAATG